MSDNIFDLVYSNRDFESHYFFDGPTEATQEDFERLCNSLLPKAGYKAALKQSAPKGGGWICWSDVVESLVSLLEEQGYQRVYFDSYYLDGGSIIGIYEMDPHDERLGFSSQVIVNYNKKLEEKLAKEREAQKAKKKLLIKKKPIQIIK